MKKLDFDLTDEEISEKAQSVSEKWIYIGQQKAKLKEIKGQYNERIKKAEDEIDRLTEQIVEGKQEKEVEATQVKNYDDNTVEFWYEGEMKASRSMEEKDRQQDLDEQKTALRNEAKKRKTESQEKKRKGLKVVSSDDAEEGEVSEVIKEETSRKTKRSALDGGYSKSQQLDGKQ